MNIDDISNTLPNGFHDAYILSINIDYVRREVAFQVDVNLSLRYEKIAVPIRRGELKLTGLLYCVIEPPAYSLSKEHVYSEDKLWIAGDSSDFGELKEYPKLPEPIPVGGFKHWFYDNKHNSFIYVAAMNANFCWSE